MASGRKPKLKFSWIGKEKLEADSFCESAMVEGMESDDGRGAEDSVCAPGTPDTVRKGASPRDGLGADLGVSRYQLTAPERGFSFMADGPLDMRMDQSTGMRAADLANHTTEKALADLIFQLGEERRARKMARAIVRARPIRSTLHLAGVVERAAPRTGRLHPATRTFMALRMAVDDEQGELDRLLEIGPDLLHAGGRKGPAGFQRFFNALREEKLFVTSLGGRTAQIYTIPAWRENEKFLASYREDPRAARNIAFNAADLGAEADIDSQGRILFSTELRRALGIENQPVRLYAYRSRIEVLSDKIYQERKSEASVNPADDLAKLAAAGFN